MIRGKTITRTRENVSDCRVEYRKIDALNVSSIKCFDNDPIKFYNEYILKKKRKDSKKSVALIIGDIADFYILDCKGDEEEFYNRFDEKFALYEGPRGMSQVFDLADELFIITQESLNNVGEVVTSFEDRFTEAYRRVTEKGLYKGKSEDKVLEDFNAKGVNYFSKLIENACRTVVDSSLLDKSKRVAQLLLTDPFTSDVFVEGNYEYLPKLSIEWDYTTTAGKVIKCKSEIDLLKVDNEKKTIHLIDLKTNYDNENFEYSYLKFRYDLQAAFYYLAVSKWVEGTDLANYEITPMQFVVGDTSASNRRPVVYKTTEKDLEAGLYGFRLNSSEYKGIHELIEEISWAEDNNSWNCTRKVVENNGVCLLNLQYE